MIIMKKKNNNPVNQASQIINNTTKHASLNSSVKQVVEILFFEESVVGNFPKVYYGLKMLLPYITNLDYENLVADAENDQKLLQNVNLTNQQLKEGRLKKINYRRVSSFDEDLAYISKNIFRINY